MNQVNSLIMIQNDNLEWMIKHPERFVDAIVSRLNSGELDKHPGYARWHGDGVPGAQVVWIGQSNFCGVVIVGNNCATRLGTAKEVKNDNSSESKEEILRQLAAQLGYSIKKINKSNKTTESNKNLKGKNDSRRTNRNSR